MWIAIWTASEQLLIPPVWDDQPVRSPLPPTEIQTSSAHFRKQFKRYDNSERNNK